MGDAISDVSAFAAEVSGRLRVSAPEDMGVAILSDIVREFLVDYPKVTVELSLDNRQVDLIKDGVDVALRVGRLKDSSLTRHHVGTVRMTFVMSPGLLERAGVVQTPEQLESLPFVAFSHDMRNRGEIKVGNGRSEKTIRPTARCAGNNHFVTRSLAAGGAGWAILPTFMAADDLKKGRLVQVLNDWTFHEVPLQFVTPKQREPAPRLERFIAFALERLAPLFA